MKSPCWNIILGFLVSTVAAFSEIKGVQNHWSVSAKLGVYSDMESKIVSDSDGNCYITGRISPITTNFVFLGTQINNLSRRDGCVWIAKVDRSGSLKWAISPKSVGYSEGRSIAIDRFGNVLICGNYAYTGLQLGEFSLQEPASGNTDGFVAKINSDGTVVWVKRISGSNSEYSSAIAVDLDENCVVAGSFYSDSVAFDSKIVRKVGQMDMFLAKYSKLGEVLWAQSFGSKSIVGGSGLAIDSSNSIFLSGFFEGVVSFGNKTIDAGPGPARHAFVAKFNENGFIDWARAGNGGGGSSYGDAVAVNSANQLYLAGFFESDSLRFGNVTINRGGASQNCYLSKFDADGTPLWTKSSRNSNYAKSAAVAVDSSGAAYLVGFFGQNLIDFDSIRLNSSGSSDGFLVKYSNHGDVEWGRVLGGIKSDDAVGVAVQDVDKLFVSGSFRSPDVVLGSTHLSSGLPIENETSSFYLTRLDNQTPKPRQATAFANVVNGFVVGITIRDQGFGYTTNPVVILSGGQGQGAQVFANLSGSAVSGITISNPGSGYLISPNVAIMPPAMPLRKASAIATAVNGFIVGVNLTDGGFGYDAPPAVLLVGGGGGGATAVATVANGAIASIQIVNPGSGYTSTATVRIASPPFTPKLSIDVAKVRVLLEVVLGRKYQIESSSDLQVWTKTGDAFVAQDEVLQQDFDVDVFGRYFRINQVP